MRRFVRRWCVLAALAWAASAGTWAAAQEEAPADAQTADQPADVAPDETGADAAAPEGPLAPGQAFSQGARANASEMPWKTAIWLIATGVLALAWVATGDWVNRDTQIFGLGYKTWNPIVFVPFAALFALLSFLPLQSVVRFPILALAYLAPSLAYVIVHNRSVEPHQTVLTPGWWRHTFAAMLGKLGVKVKSERMADYEKGAAVDLFAMGAGGANEDNVNLLTARQSPGYLLVKDLIADMSTRRSDRVHFEYGPQGVAVRHEIDGVWHNGEARDRESGDVMLAVIKTLCNLDAKERKKKQEGKFGAQFEGKKLLCPVVCQGVANGERVILSRRHDKDRPRTYEGIGLREGLREQWEEIMARDRGLVVLSAMPGGGLTTLIDASIEETDRLMRDFFAIEEVNHREHELQNVTVHTYDASKGQTPGTLMPALVRLYPNVYIVRDMVDAESAKLLMNEIPDDRLVITSVQARDAPEALLRLLQMKLPQQQFASVVSAVLYQRLVRKLCPDCKVGYQPPADVLKKLGIPPGKVQQLYRPPKPEEIEKPCQTCQGIGYVGRTGIFELLVVNDQMRDILARQPSLDLLRKAARADQQRSLQEEGILLVAKGVTSLPELMRVLK